MFLFFNLSFHIPLSRIESIQLRFMMVNGKREGGLIVSAGKDGLIKYWDIEQ